MNIKELKEYINELPDDMEIYINIGKKKCNIFPTVEGKELIL